MKSRKFGWAFLAAMLAAPQTCAAHGGFTAGEMFGMLHLELKSLICRSSATVEKRTALMEAAAEGDVEAVKRLIAEGAKVNDVLFEPHLGHSSSHKTALMEAARGGHAEVVQALIAAGAQVDLKDGGCETALMKAAWSGHADVVALLLAAGAKASRENIDGRTALEQAMERERAETVRVFLDAGVRLKRKDRNLAMTLAACNGVELLQAVQKAGARPSEEALVAAAQCGNVETLRALLDLQVDASARDLTQIYAKTALMWAAENGHLEAVRMLLDAGADVNAHAASFAAWDRVKPNGKKLKPADMTGHTALMLAILEKRVEVVRALIAGGADVNAVDSCRGRTPLMWAAFANASNAVVRALLDAGADLNAVDAEGERAVDLLLESLMRQRLSQKVGAEEFGALLRDLLEAGADVNLKAESISMAFEMTPLMLAAAEGDVELVKSLLSAGADPNAIDNYGQTALMWAARFTRAKAAQALLEGGADVDVKSCWDQTALDLAHSDELKAILQKARAMNEGRSQTKDGDERD